MIIMCTDRQ